MYDLRQFRPTLYAVLLLGVSGFAYAAEAPGLWLLAVIAILLNGYLVKNDAFTPLPRLLANVITLLAMVYVAYQFRFGSTPVLVIGQFLVLLQLVKLYEQRGNRDYGQLLVLSLLLMVAASINTASLLFALLLIIYLFLSLYCCLLFHLKVETDYARSALSIRDDQANPATLRQDQSYLSSSMRRLTVLVSAVAIAAAVVVFLFFPRNAGSGFLSPLQMRQRQAMTGISDQVSFQQIARIQQNTEPVAHVWVQKNGQAVQGGTLLLRSVTLDVYTGSSKTGPGPWRWIRSRAFNDPPDMMVYQNAPQPLPPPNSAAQFSETATDTWRQRIVMQPSGSRYLFAMAGPFQILSADRDLTVHYSDRDETLQSLGPLGRPIEYEVLSHEELLQPVPAYLNSIERSQIDPQMTEFARRPDVAGSDAQGSLADQRPRDALTHELDGRIAANFESWLQRNCAYTLDLTDATRLSNEDPLVAFVQRLKRGHCEYFAGAMTLMCQSLGMKARVVVGFKCDEFNPYGGHFMVRQSHAHAWVEVLTPQGWRSYDPTSGREAPPAQLSAWQKARYLLDYMEFQWASKVVAYDNDDRDSLVEAVDARITNTAIKAPRAWSNLLNWLDLDPQSWVLRSYLVLALMGLLVLGLLVAVGRFLAERWRLRRRALHLGLDALPGSDRIRLARQLGFYDDLMRLLQKQGIQRPRHLTPMEFSRSLDFLPADAYDAIRRLTYVFYRVRFGRTELRPHQQARLRSTLSRLAEALAPGR